MLNLIVNAESAGAARHSLSKARLRAATATSVPVGRHGAAGGAGEVGEGGIAGEAGAAVPPEAVSGGEAAASGPAD